jgi:hypothetical protein
MISTFFFEDLFADVDENITKLKQNVKVLTLFDLKLALISFNNRVKRRSRSIRRKMIWERLNELFSF